jgi:hypothetical protein
MDLQEAAKLHKNAGNSVKVPEIRTWPAGSTGRIKDEASTGNPN